jgi:hypothetical protein
MDYNKYVSGLMGMKFYFVFTKIKQHNLIFVFAKQILNFSIDLFILSNDFVLLLIGL